MGTSANRKVSALMVTRGGNSTGTAAQTEGGICGSARSLASAFRARPARMSSTVGASLQRQRNALSRFAASSSRSFRKAFFAADLRARSSMYWR